MKSNVLSAALAAASILAAGAAWAQAPEAPPMLRSAAPAAPAAGAAAPAAGAMDHAKGMMDHGKGMMDHAKKGAADAMDKMAPSEKK